MKLKLALLTTAAMLALAGCGGSSSSSDGMSDEDQIKDLASTAADYLDSNEVGNYCELLSPAAIKEVENTEGLDDASCEGVMLLIGGTVSDSDIDAMKDPASIEVTGDEAVVTYDQADLGFNAEKIDGEWMIGPNE